MNLLNAFTIAINTKILPLIYAIIGFGLLITIHELGHFFFCKIFNIYTPSFSIGMGPKIFEKKIGTTNFKISALPIGGYVEIAGQSEVGQGEQEHANFEGGKSFKNKSYWKKALVISGGVLFNILFAYIAYSLLFFVGIPKKKTVLLIKKEVSSEITKTLNLKPNDQIVKINNIKLSIDAKNLIPELQKNLVQPINKKASNKITFTILRNEKQKVITIETSNKKLNEKLLNSLHLSSNAIKGKYEKHTFFKAIHQGIRVTNEWIIQIFSAFKQLITQKSLKGAGGPIMILSKTFETAQQGIIPLLIFLAFISINLAVINILPIGALDGGQFLFITIEAIIRREIPEIIKLAINIASWVLILGLILYLSYKDLIFLITGKHI